MIKVNSILEEEQLQEQKEWDMRKEDKVKTEQNEKIYEKNFLENVKNQEDEETRRGEEKTKVNCKQEVGELGKDFVVKEESMEAGRLGSEATAGLQAAGHGQRAVYSMHVHQGRSRK